MKKSALLLAVLASLVGSTAFAIPISLNFSFQQSGNNFAGIIDGLEDNGAGQAATSVFVTASTAGYGVGEYVGNPVVNDWTLVNGVITAVNFLSHGAANIAPEVVCCSIQITSFYNPIAASLANNDRFVLANPDHPVTFTPTGTDVPVPAPIALIGLGLLGIGISRRGQKLSA